MQRSIGLNSTVALFILSALLMFAIDLCGAISNAEFLGVGFSAESVLIH